MKRNHAPTQDPTTTAPNSAPTIIEPTCKDSTLRFNTIDSSNDNEYEKKSCTWVGQKKVKRCMFEHAGAHCPKTCDTCESCSDSTATFIYKQKKETCGSMKKWTCYNSDSGVSDTCRKICGACETTAPSPRPVSSPFPSKAPTTALMPVQTTTAPTQAPTTTAPTPAPTTTVPTQAPTTTATTPASTTTAPTPAPTTTVPTQDPTSTAPTQDPTTTATTPAPTTTATT